MVLSRQTYIIRCPNCETKNRVPKSKLSDHPVCGKCRTHLPTEPLFPEQPLEVSDHTFPHEVLSFRGRAAAYFWSPGCVYCRSLGPAIDHLASIHAGRIKFVKVLLDHNPYVSSKLSVMSVPTLILFDHGKEVDRLVGEVPREHLETRLKRFSS